MEKIFRAAASTSRSNGELRCYDPSIYADSHKYNSEELKLALENFYNFAVEDIYNSAGWGGTENQIQNHLAAINRFGIQLPIQNQVLTGPIFITRPSLNLSLSSIRMNNILGKLDTLDPNDVNFMIRGLLDPMWFDALDSTIQLGSQLIDIRSPWLTPVMNSISSISGFPDITGDIDRSESGYFSESMTTFAGSNRLRSGADLNLSFNDIDGSIIYILFHMWMEYMSAVRVHELTARSRDIDENLLNYTVSIYYFLLGPDKQTIRHWVKATGCFPNALPSGARFNKNENDGFVAEASKFSIPFVANDISYDNLTTIFEFNILCKRYWADIDLMPETPSAPSKEDKALHLRYNRIGLPYIKSTDDGMKLVYKYVPGFLSDKNPNEYYNSLKNGIEELNKQKFDQYQKDSIDLYKKIAPLLNSKNGGIFKFNDVLIKDYLISK